MSQKEKYFIRTKGNLVSVSHEVYLCYYRMGRREKWLGEKDFLHGTVFYSNMDTENLLGEDLICDSISQPVEEQVIDRIRCDEIHNCISLLSKSDQEVIQALFFDYFTERQYADVKGVTQGAINKGKKRILKKLKKKFTGIRINGK